MSQVIEFTPRRIISGIEKALDSFEVEGIAELQAKRDRLRIEAFTQAAKFNCERHIKDILLEIEKAGIVGGATASVEVLDYVLAKLMTKKE